MHLSNRTENKLTEFAGELTEFVVEPTGFHKDRCKAAIGHCANAGNETTDISKTTEKDPRAIQLWKRQV